MKTKAVAKLRAYWLLSLAIVAVWAMGYILGSRLPYIYTDFAFNVRAFVAFPILFCAICYFVFLHRNKKSEWKTGYDIAMSSFKTKTAKAKATIWGVTGLLLLPSGLAWTTVAFSALAAEFIASTPFSKTYTVKEIKERGGPVWSTLFDLTLVGSESDVVDLRLNRHNYEMYHWKTGDVICVRGRTSIFGAIADTVAKGVCSEKGDTH